MGIGRRGFRDRRLKLREPRAAALNRVEPRGKLARQFGKRVGLTPMFARHRAQLEQPRFGGFQPLRVIFHCARCFVQLGLGLVGLDDCAVERGERLGKQRMIAGEPVEPPRRAAQQRRSALAAVKRFHDRA